MHMPLKQVLEEKTGFMDNQKIILQLTRLLEQQNLISTSERIKMADFLKKGQ